MATPEQASARKHCLVYLYYQTRLMRPSTASLIGATEISTKQTYRAKQANRPTQQPNTEMRVATKPRAGGGLSRQAVVGTPREPRRDARRTLLLGFGLFSLAIQGGCRRDAGTGLHTGLVSVLSALSVHVGCRRFAHVGVALSGLNNLPT